ncbi:hypothetical protein RUK98_002388 [Vibrio cholerae]|nr:hypothetical protein [Vibrio cholerae]ELJ8716721.1 hypothetical protein [Vibrio cholerae]MCD6668160.1 hypothetical protein [Vibrio cholerae]
MEEESIIGMINEESGKLTPKMPHHIIHYNLNKKIKTAIGGFYTYD